MSKKPGAKWSGRLNGGTRPRAPVDYDVRIAHLVVLLHYAVLLLLRAARSATTCARRAVHCVMVSPQVTVIAYGYDQYR